jgi:hypothetical protein
MHKGQHVHWYVQPPFGGALVTLAGHYNCDLGDGTHRIFVTLDEDGSVKPVEGPQCDAATPTAGHWSTIP